jgi:AbrB family looped-hinge helix DNA binding protein
MKPYKNQYGLGTIGGVAVLGERGQLVVPKEIRNRLKLKAGDDFLVIEHFGKIILVPQKQAEGFISHIVKEWSKVNKRNKK